MHSILGKVAVDGRPQAWPLSAMTARRFGAGRLALIGEAAHVFPPIGAQGLNLSLRDIGTALELAMAARGASGGLAIGESYDRRRRADIVSRTAAIDLVKAGRPERAAPLFEAAAWRLLDRGAQRIILACTEVPIGFEHLSVQWRSRTLDATDTLARACVAWSLGEAVPMRHNRAHGSEVA